MIPRHWSKGSRGVHTDPSGKMWAKAISLANECRCCKWDNKGTCQYNATCGYPKSMFEQKEE